MNYDCTYVLYIALMGCVFALMNSAIVIVVLHCSHCTVI